MIDWTQIIQMAFGGGIVAGIVEVCAAIRHRKADKIVKYTDLFLK